MRGILLWRLLKLSLMIGSAVAQEWTYSCLASTNASEIVEGLDATGKVVVITGADGNIGSRITANIAKTHATTVLACHNATNCENMVKSLQDELALDGIEGVFDTLTIDLSDFTSIRNAAASLLSTYPSIDVLVNNAACSSCVYLTNDGLVADMQTNHYGPALFTQLLLPALITEVGTSRVVNVASASGYGPFVEQDYKTTLTYSSLQEIADVWSRNVSSLSMNMFYSVSKFLVMQYNNEFAKRYDGQLVSFATSPGFAREPVTPQEKFQCASSGLDFSPCPMTYEQAATVEVLAALSPGIESYSGSYLDFDTTIYTETGQWTQVNPSCMPRPLPGWLGTDGTNVMWTDDDRAQWYDIVQDLLAPYF
jgi:NAD(P)-dependent dehydrogenase (short-subunit alcohol dehydrogenase family)